MADRFVVECEVTRTDWIAANEVLISTSPAWEAHARSLRRRGARNMLWLGPATIGGAAYFIGTQGATRGMYLEGALGGAALVGLMSLYFCRLETYSRPAKEAAVREVRRAEYGDRIGRIRVTMDEAGVSVKTSARQLRLGWSAVVVYDLGEHPLIPHAGDGTVIPKRAFPTSTEAATLIESSRRWWQMGQMPMAERVARYVADRDVRCGKCGYNLRGITKDACPECGTQLTVEELQRAPQG